jgi:hypothetical protein
MLVDVIYHLSGEPVDALAARGANPPTCRSRHRLDEVGVGAHPASLSTPRAGGSSCDHGGVRGQSGPSLPQHPRDRGCALLWASPVIPPAEVQPETASMGGNGSAAGESRKKRAPGGSPRRESTRCPSTPWTRRTPPLVLAPCPHPTRATVLHIGREGARGFPGGALARIALCGLGRKNARSPPVLDLGRALRHLTLRPSEEGNSLGGCHLPTLQGGCPCSHRCPPFLLCMNLPFARETLPQTDEWNQFESLTSSPGAEERAPVCVPPA